VPPGVTTERVTFPATFAGATAVICVAELTVNEVALVSPKVTAVVPVKLVPAITTVVPPEVEPELGVTLVIDGAEAVNVKARVALPPGESTVTLTAAAGLAGVIATICEAETTVKDAAARLPNLTEVTSVRFEPEIVTVVPPAVVPEAGLSDEIDGVARYVYVELRVAPGVTTFTVIAPAAFAGAIAEIVVELITVKDLAFVPSNVTAVVPKRLVPEIVITVSPAVGPLVGESDVIVGAV